MIIESKGKEVASSGDISHSSSDHLSFTQNTSGAFEYQCESHLDAMKDFVIYCGYYGIKDSIDHIRT
jgi:plastocyanin